MPTSNPPLFSLSTFSEPQRWVFAKECPPPLRDERFWVRGMRATIILMILGGFAGLISAVVYECFEEFDWTRPIAVIPGLCFGVFVLTPLARWLPRRSSGLQFILCGLLIYLPLMVGIHHPATRLWLIGAITTTTYWLCPNKANTRSPHTLLALLASTILSATAFVVAFDDFGLMDALKNARGIPLSYDAMYKVASIVGIVQFHAILGAAVSTVCWSKPPGPVSIRSATAST